MLLASASADRLRLLRDAGYTVTASPSGVAEPPFSRFGDVDTYVSVLAELKARAVQQRGGAGLIFAADTVGVAAGEVFGKPSGREDARRMLAAISGSMHEVVTGWRLLRARDNLMLGGVERTVITMRPWTDAELDAYLDSGEWQGKCGAYGLQLPHDPFVTDIVGSTSNVIGVPLERLHAVLHEFNLLPDDAPPP